MVRDAVTQPHLDGGYTVFGQVIRAWKWLTILPVAM